MRARIAGIVLAIAVLCSQTAIAQRELFNNNASSTLATAINATDTSIVVASGHGARFPNPSGGDYFYVTLENNPVTQREIIRCTARATDTLTCSRGEQGTTGVSWSVGATVSHRLTVAPLNEWSLMRNAPYITTAATADLPNETALSAVSAGSFPTLNQSTTGNAATATALAADPTDCGANQHATAIDASGNLTCGTVPPPTTVIAGNTGTANSAVGETWMVLTANCTANATTTAAACMTINSLPAGSYTYEFQILYSSSVTTTGVTFQVDAGGTVTAHVMTRLGITALATAADGIADQTVTAVTGGVIQGWAQRSDAANLGPSAGVDTINVAIMERIEGILITSTSGNFRLMHASETANSTQVLAGSSVIIKRIN